MEEKLTEIQDLINAQDLTQKQIAVKVGVNHIHLNSVLKGRNSLTEGLYQRLKYHLIK